MAPARLPPRRPRRGWSPCSGNLLRKRGGRTAARPVAAVPGARRHVRVRAVPLRRSSDGAGVRSDRGGGRGLVGLFAVPLLALAMARNREWRVDIHVSRTVVLHTAALVASGIFFMVLAAVGALVRQLGGGWGASLRFSPCSEAPLFWPGFWSRGVSASASKQIIARHFFSHRFDYRTEWLRFVDTFPSRASAKTVFR